ncbi:uncharacterized protein PpBr36_11290 [Pyricularia pennisetigena]|uniref:uncharacterized protein n=1 Tax=Pyricularia pennisetigena TaxID=1578925 RepID=UPI0011524461|nr:uncharacterized protein PpBr36_11290 [Pyricularia pennisetigena]TLS20580.1 hypothetical protein PpBr36_11290 [Pyricularia pennisetigena]
MPDANGKFLPIYVLQSLHVYALPSMCLYCSIYRLFGWSLFLSDSQCFELSVKSLLNQRA